MKIRLKIKNFLSKLYPFNIDVCFKHQNTSCKLLKIVYIIQTKVQAMHQPREQVENHGRACTQVLFLSKAELGFFHSSVFLKSEKIVKIFSTAVDPSSLADIFHCKRSRLLKTSFFRQVRELKIQRKNRGSALW
jgi:hypothetical protein